LVVAFIATLHLRESAVEDERISRLAPAFSALHFVSQVGTQFDPIVSMEPLVIQMYADPTTRIVDLESVSSDTLRALMPPSGEAQLIFLKESSTLSDVEMSRYGEQVRYLVSQPSSILLDTDRFRILRVDVFKSR
jgi:hypothetical protein